MRRCNEDKMRRREEKKKMRRREEEKRGVEWVALYLRRLGLPASPGGLPPGPRATAGGEPSQNPRKRRSARPGPPKNPRKEH